MKIIQPAYEIIDTGQEGIKALKHIEKIGRTCYKSENLITEDSAKRFVANLIKNEHEAMIEHVSITVLFTTDRGVSHESVRHREASFAQESTRYCNYGKDKFGKEITYIDLSGAMALEGYDVGVDKAVAIYDEWVLACKDAERHYFRMLELGASPQIARSVLNHSTKTDIWITANLREWRHILKLRTDKSAHPAIREIMIPLLRDLHMRYPVVFDDIFDKVEGEVFHE